MESLETPEEIEQNRRDAIVENHDDTEPCRHGNRFWCEECVTEAFVLHSAHGRWEGLQEAIGLAVQLAGDAFMKDKTDVAEALKGLVHKLTVLAKKHEEEANKARRAQGIQ